MKFLEQADLLVREKLGIPLPPALPLPVRYDGMNYFWGPENQVVGDQVSDYTQGEYKDDTLGEPFRIRGWGRIQYMQDDTKTPAQLQDEVAYFIADAINAYSKVTLHHYLKVLDQAAHKAGIVYKLCNCGVLKYQETIFHFDLTNGAPASETDAEIFIKLVS